MITREQYFQAKPHDAIQAIAADALLDAVNGLIAEFVTKGGSVYQCPNTGTQISGSKGGQGDGGFRLETATTGKGHSSHKEARGVDVFDPHDILDNWLTTFDKGLEKNAMLEKYGLYREHPGTTPTWCHLTTRAPLSGHRTFWP